MSIIVSQESPIRMYAELEIFGLLIPISFFQD